MKQVLVTTCYLEGVDEFGSGRLERNILYLQYYRKLFGPEMPIWFLDSASSEEKLTALQAIDLNTHIHVFDEDIPRRGIGPYDYPHCWQGLWFLKDMIYMFPQLEKIIFIDSDCFIVSERLKKYVLDLNSGWVGFVEQLYSFHTSEFFVLNRDTFPRCQKYMNEPFENKYGKLMEMDIPFTRICREFNYGRFGERDLPVMKGMDAYGQIRTHTAKKLLEVLVNGKTL